jgi:murein DD-endopeptidase MepM/ murein hydrolase activator NlpD
MESAAPLVSLDFPGNHIGIAETMHVRLEDSESGLKRFWIGIMQNGKEIDIFEKRFPATGILRKGAITGETAEVSIEPKKIGLSDGPAMLRMMAVDYSWKKMGKGNRAYIEKEIVIDTKAPEITILTNAHNISPGGSGLIVYELSEPCEKSGVMVDDLFYPGYPGLFKSEDRFTAFFAMHDEKGPGTDMALMAIDNAGNLSKTGFPVYIKKKTFKNDVIHISDRFIDSKQHEFESELSGLQVSSSLERFLHINRDVRQQNKNRIDDLVKDTDKQLHWEGSFLRLPRSATRATFGERRTYHYKEQVVDRQVHRGIDLASVAQTPIPAANSGRIAFADRLGIYGKTILIDHGFGLFSLYAHLSSFTVQAGRLVARGDIIGHTGMTGLAGGDHLHFSMLVHETFVDPLEWWDMSWIKNNITNKIERLKYKE